GVSLPASHPVRSTLAAQAGEFPERTFQKISLHGELAALNFAEWLRLGFRMGFSPVRPGQNSTYTRVRNSETTSYISTRASSTEASRRLYRSMIAVSNGNRRSFGTSPTSRIRGVAQG